MAGLFGYDNGLLTPEEQKYAQMQGLLGLGANLLSASGPSTTPIGTGQAIGQGLLAYQNGVQGGMKNAIENKMMASRLNEMKFQQQAANEFLRRFAPQGQQSQQSPAPQGGAPFYPGISQMPQTNEAQSNQPQGDLAPEFIYGALAKGYGGIEDIGKELQKQRDPIVGQGGVFFRNGRDVQLAPGYATGRGQTTAAEEAAKSQYELTKVSDRSGAEYTVPKSLVLGSPGGNPQGTQGGSPQNANRFLSKISPISEEYQKKLATNQAEYENNLNSRVQQGGDLNMRLQESLKALNKFDAGGGGETRAQLGQMAQAIGAPSSVVNKIAGGDLSAIQEFKKLAVQQAMEQLKQSLGGQGKMGQREFIIFEKNNPNLSTDPDAIKKIFDFNTRVYNRDLGEQEALQGFRSNPRNNPVDFPAFWAREQTRRGFTNPSLSAQNPSSTNNPSKKSVADYFK